MIQPRFSLHALFRGPRAGAAILAVAIALLQQPATAQSLIYSVFERYLERLAVQAAIPGLSAAIVQNGVIAWEHGFGYQDVENFIQATPRTPYPIADLTQTFASVLLMQCVERGTLRLDDPLSKWAVEGDESLVGRVLSHTSGTGPPFKYDPARFAQLTAAVDVCGQVGARQRVVQEVFQRFGMMDSVPGRDLAEASADVKRGFDQAQLDRYDAVLTRLATPYKVDRRGRATRSDFPSKKIDASTGLVSTVRDLALYDRALEDFDLLRETTQNQMWSKVTAAPMGLGWFVQTYITEKSNSREKIVWHFGNTPDAYSSLILKVPSKHLTLILLANSDGLSAPFNLAEGDVTASLFAQAFLSLLLP